MKSLKINQKGAVTQSQAIRAYFYPYLNLDLAQSKIILCLISLETSETLIMT